jgi:hypothetical protein
VCEGKSIWGARARARARPRGKSGNNSAREEEIKRELCVRIY